MSTLDRIGDHRTARAFTDALVPMESKDELKRRLTLLKYPRRKAAVFAGAPEHNLLVLENCR